MGTTAYGDPGSFRATKHVSVFLSYGKEVHEVLIYANIPLMELQECLAAGFLHQLDATSSNIPVAVKDPRKDIYYPISLLRKSPELFKNTSYEILFSSSGGGNEEEALNAAKDRKKHHKKRSHHKKKQSSKLSSIRKDFDSPAHDDEDKQDDEEFLRELDLTDFELPLLVNEFTQASPTGVLDRTSFERSLEKILSQSGRYDPLARKMFRKLFDIFDHDNKGVVDTTEFLGGLSVLASGERDEKIRYTFELYDVDNDGFITLEQMTKYLTAVFLVIAETSPEIFHHNDVDHLELGIVTAKQCFAESDLNEEGQLSYDAFRQWYSTSGAGCFVRSTSSSAESDEIDNEPVPMVPDSISTLEYIRELTGLQDVSVEDMFSILSEASNDGSALTRDEFKRAFITILQSQKKRPSREMAAFLDRLFYLFDVDENDQVDFAELSSGLSILCGGSGCEEKVSAAFSLFDADGDGFITAEEMEKYLGSVFAVLYESSPAIKQNLQIDPKLLAKYTTTEAFKEADLNHDGLLSFEEFRKWYDSGNASFLLGANQMKATSFQPQGSLTSALDLLDIVGTLTTLRERKPAEVFEIVAAKVNEEGVLSREAFYECFEQLLSSKPRNHIERKQIDSVLGRLFDAFDQDGNGFVDFCELCSGLSVFCDGTQHDKIRAAFKLFDVNQDGFISREEMEVYLSSVFRVIFATSPTASSMNISPEKLAKITTDQAFADAGAYNNDRLSLKEFTQWYTASDPNEFNVRSEKMSAAVSITSESNQSQLFSKEALNHLKDATNLGSYDVNDIFEFFKASADSDGNLDKVTFFRCFNKLIARNNGSLDKPKVAKNYRASQIETREALEMLFSLFDTDGNDVIDVQELGSGLSILCGGNNMDKAQSLFTLYDLNNDGFISRDEMSAHLESVFKVLYRISPNLQDQVGGLKPHQLAQETTKSCFQQFDTNHDNSLSLEEFTQWIRNQSTLSKQLKRANSAQYAAANSTGMYLPSSAKSVSSSVVAEDGQDRSASIIPLDVARKLLGLNTMPVEKLVSLFANFANEEGLVSRQAFDAYFYKYLCSGVESAVGNAQLHEVIDRLFTAFDVDQDGYVDLNELLSGLTILCGGSRKDKVQAAFKLYDENGDGLISIEEMIHYLTSVFKLMYALDPTHEFRHQHMTGHQSVSPEKLASLTAAEIFQEADLNHDGKLNMEEFDAWFTSGGADELPENPLDGEQQTTLSEILLAPVSLNEVRRLTNLGSMDFLEVFDLFAEHADDEGFLSRQDFDRCFLHIIEAALHPHTPQELMHARVVADQLFQLFDVHHHGKIDFSELASGLSVLCKGARDSKVKAAFSLYDHNGDGFISMDEIARYLTSIFKVLYQIQPQMRSQTGVSAEELGAITAEQAFAAADSNGDGKLSYKEFLNWYSSPDIISENEAQPGQLASHTTKLAVIDSPLRWIPLNEIKHITNLHAFEPDSIFEIFATHADGKGLLSRTAFNVSFNEIFARDSTIHKRTPEQKQFIKDVVNGLFDLFDADGSGYVDFGELASGLSVLCGGSEDQKVEAAFSLFDFNGDGYISLEEMTRYLSSVFRILYQVSPETQSFGVSPDELGAITAEQAFEEADLDHDGRLSLEEFKSWYQHADGICQVAQSGEQLFSLAEARRLTNLDDYSVMEIFEALAECADDQGYVSKEDFDNCFRKLILSDNSKNKKSKAMKEEEVNHINSILNRLFDLFDTDKSGRVDFSEISSGLSVLCGGTSDEKVRAAFALYDYNGDGYISLEEMTRYLTCVFKVLKEASPDSLRRISEQATTHDVEELGARTAEQAFLEADIDHDGRLSFEEFHKWYTSSSTANIERLIENNIPEWLSLREVRRLTNLETYTASEVFDVFADFSSIEGTLDKEAFHAAFDQLAAANNDPASNDRLRVMVERLFELFDSDKNGFVDFSELASGLSVLCGGHHVDKVRAAFNLYDVNNDGFVSLGEMRLYLTSVFKVLYEVNPETESRMGVSAEELATITAEQAFIDADRDHDGRLSFEEFSKWYMQAPTGETGIGSEEIAIKNGSHVPEWVSLEVVREMTHLEKHSASSVFELFAARCSDDGTLDRDSFELCFEELIDSKYKNDKEHMTRLRLILDRLFVIFDTDGNGVVDFCELSSGLSVLCGGSREDKVRSAFALYDLNQDGFISLEEMNRYLASVFKVLYETNPGTEQRLGVTSEVLALITAEQCFAEADLNHDGRLSFDEFVKWYSKGPLPLQGLPQTNGVYTVSGNAEMSDDGQVDEDKDAETSEVLDMNSSGMDRVRKLLKLDLYEVNDMLEIFAEAAPSGELTFAAFKKCFDQIIKLAGGHGSNEERQEAEQIIRRLFRAFDSDKSNTVDFGELASGLSVLSGSSLDDKVRAAFQLYDINGDGDISLDEMISYMTSIFKVMYETSDNAKNKMGVSPEELAKVTATQCFKEADLNHDQKLSFEEFKKWCTSGLQ